MSAVKRQTLSSGCLEGGLLGYEAMFMQLEVKSALYVDVTRCTGSCAGTVVENLTRFDLVTTP
jgi:hypothetical protein